jgi:hypothetical protein
MAPPPELLSQARDAERDYAVEVSARFGYLCAHLLSDPCGHWDADDGPRLRAQLDAARVPRRTVPSGQGARS